MVIKFSKDTNYGWYDDNELNMMSIKLTERWANDKLRMHGFVMLCEIEGNLGNPKNIIEYNPDKHSFESSNELYAWVAGHEERVELQCEPQENGDILINANCGKYPLIFKEAGAQ